MTKPKQMLTCPVCGRSFWYVSRHLVTAHHIQNQQERNLLNGLATGHIALGTVQCPVASCTQLVKNVKTHLARQHSEKQMLHQSLVLKMMKKSMLEKVLRCLILFLLDVFMPILPCLISPLGINKD